MMLAGVLCAQAPAKKLAVERLALHQYEDGPELAASYTFVPGETAHFSGYVGGFQVEKKGEEQSVKIDWKIRVVDPSGMDAVKEQSGVVADRILPQDKNWQPKFLITFMVPPFAPSGTFRVIVTIKDEISGGEATGELPFTVHGKPVEASDTLTTRNFEFLKSENDRSAMREAIFHPGEMLWAKFDITGYKLGEGNRFEVTYGLAVQTTDGKQLFAQPDAATDANQSFYPQRYVPASLSLTLNPNVPKGSFVLVVAVRDKVGNQSWETKQPFEIQ